MKDLWRWARDPLSALERGASTGEMFKLQLWRSIFIGYRPAWNERILTDLDAFPGVTGTGGRLAARAPADPSLGHAMAAAVAEVLPRRDFDAVAWAREAVRAMLGAAHKTAEQALARAVWLLGGNPRWQDPAALPRVVDEVLRLYPAVWLGTRVASRDVVLDGVPLKKGSLVGYSPYLTHRDPALWADPAEFRPDRFDTTPEPWSYLPFGGGGDGGGADLVRRMLMTALVPLCERGLTARRGGQTDGSSWMIPGLRVHPLPRRSAV